MKIEKHKEGHICTRCKRTLQCFAPRRVTFCEEGLCSYCFDILHLCIENQREACFSFIALSYLSSEN